MGSSELKAQVGELISIIERSEEAKAEVENLINSINGGAEKPCKDKFLDQNFDQLKAALDQAKAAMSTKALLLDTALHNAASAGASLPEVEALQKLIGRISKQHGQMLNP